MPTPNETEQEEKSRLWAEMDAAGDAGGSNAAKPAENISNVNEGEQPAPAAQADALATPDAQDADIYAGLPNAVKDELVGLKTMLAKSEARLRNTEGHIGGLKTQLQQLAAAQAKPGAEGPSAAELRNASGSKEAMSRLLEDYPELGGTFKSALEEAMRPLQEQLQGLTSKATPQGVSPEELHTFRSEMIVESHHPNWQERVRTAQFQGWLQSQPREVQMLAASDSPQDAIRLLDLNSEASKSSVQTRNQRLTSAAAMPTGRTSAQRAKPVESMTKEEYWAYLDSVEQKA